MASTNEVALLLQSHIREADTLALREFNDHLLADQRIDLSLVPIGDGLTLARRLP